MANPERGEVDLVVNKRRFILLLDIEAITAIERVSGERLAAAVQRLSDAEFPIRLLVLFATAMLARRHPDLTAGMIGELGRKPTRPRCGSPSSIRFASRSPMQSPKPSARRSMATASPRIGRIFSPSGLPQAGTTSCSGAAPRARSIGT